MDASPEKIAESKQRRTRVLVVLALALVPIAVFWPILAHGLVYDDLYVVRRNPLIANFAQIPAQFTSGMWDFLGPIERERIGYWRPLTNVALTFVNVWGDGSPRAFHALSLALHALATMAAFALAVRVTGRTLLAVFVALLFALHPAQVESVAWISAVNSLLFGLFSLLALERFLAWRDKGSRGVPWASGVLLFLSLLSKELAVATIACAAALDATRGSSRVAPAAAGKLTERLAPIGRAYGPMAAALLAYYLARVLVFGSLVAGLDATSTHFDVPAQRMALMRFEMLGGFLHLLAWPAHLNLFRPFVPELEATGAAMAPAWLAILVFAALAVIAWRTRSRIVIGALAFVLAAIAPVVVNVSSHGIFPLADRFLYLAIFGLAVVLAWSALRWLPTLVACLSLSALAATCAVSSHARLPFWRDEGTLYDEAVVESPDSPTVVLARARGLLERYRASMLDPNAHDLETLKAAHEAFDHALSLADAAQHGNGRIFATVDNFVEANLGLGWCLLYEAELDEYHDFETPLAVFKGVVQRYPDHESAHTALGVALQRLGRFDEAESAFTKATELNPSYAESWHNLGAVRLLRGNWKGAVEAFERSLALRPDHLDDMLLLARAEAENGHPERTIELCERAERRHPEASGPLVWRATVLAQKGDFDAAIELVRRAIELDPNDGEAQLLKGRLHARVGEQSAATRAFLRAATLLPGSFEAQYSAASVTLQEKENGLLHALPYLMRAYELRPGTGPGVALRDLMRQLPLTDADTVYELASSDAARGLEADALDWVGRALAIKPDHGPSHYLQGFLLKKRGDEEGAIASWTKACAEMPESIQARQSLGMSYAARGDHAHALQYLEEALSLAREAEGSNPEAQAALDQLASRVEEERGRVQPK